MDYKRQGWLFWPHQSNSQVSYKITVSQHMSSAITAFMQIVMMLYRMNVLIVALMHITISMYSVEIIMASIRLTHGVEFCVNPIMHWGSLDL